MTSGLCKPKAGTTGSSALRLEIADREAKNPRLIPVKIRNLSTGGVTLAVTNPWDIPDLDRYRGQDCLLRMEDPEGGEPLTIKANLAWTRSGGTGQSSWSMGLQLLKPPGEAISRLNRLLPHTSQDIKGLWDRYDQVQKSPKKSDVVHHCYIAGLVLLVGGLVLQFAGSPGYKVYGWVFWGLGSLGIAGKITRPFWHKQPSGDRIG